MEIIHSLLPWSSWSSGYDVRSLTQRIRSPRRIKLMIHYKENSMQLRSKLLHSQVTTSDGNAICYLFLFETNTNVYKMFLRERSLIMTWEGGVGDLAAKKKCPPPYGNTPKINDQPYGNTLKKSAPPLVKLMIRYKENSMLLHSKLLHSQVTLWSYIIFLSSLEGQ